MTNDRKNLDPVEEALLELDATERAHLFKLTSADTRRLLESPTGQASTGSRRIALRWLPVAAAVVIAVGVWSWAFRVEPLASARATISDCLTGPDEVVAVTCRGYDSDADGDVDLADFHSYQVAFAGTGH